jgi:hypothetical protein
VGEAYGKVLDETMRELPCAKIEVDEIWGYVGKPKARAFVGRLRMIG